MKRSELLQENLTKDQDTDLAIKKVLQDDSRILKREQRQIEDEVEDLEVELRDRLSSTASLDKSVVLGIYSTIQAKKQQISLYKSFREEFL